MLLDLSPELLALGFRPPQTQEELLWLGVHCVLSRWTAFRMAVEGGFSSRDPARAAAEYVAGIREFLMTGGWVKYMCWRGNCASFERKMGGFGWVLSEIRRIL
jgi:hypothetical protein